MFPSALADGAQGTCSASAWPAACHHLPRCPAATDPDQIGALNEMDAPENMAYLHKLGTLVGARDVRPDHFPAAFDL